MPFQVKGANWISCREEIALSTAGSSRAQQVVVHEVGTRSPISLSVEKVWSYEDLVIPFPAGLTLDFGALPQGIPGITKDLKTDQTLNMMWIDNLSNDTQITIQLLLAGTPLPGIGYALGPSNVFAQYDDAGESLLFSFVDGMQIDVIQGDVEGHIEIMLGTISTLPPT